MKGTVKWFDETKGYGFIQDSQTKKDFFVHISEVQKAGFKSLKDGQKVEFEIQKTTTRDGAEKISACDIKVSE